MGIKQNELPGLLGKTLIILVIDEDNHLTGVSELRGKLHSVNPGTNLVLKMKRNSRIVKMDEIVDIYEESASIRLSPRQIGPVEIGFMRQHLLDRHGVALTAPHLFGEGTAESWHNEINHGDLGHRHQIRSRPELFRELFVRHVGDLEDREARQHLANAHGWPTPVLASLDLQIAVEMHATLSHEHLGHRHDKSTEV